MLPKRLTTSQKDEVIGYIMRILSAREGPDYSTALFIAQATPTLLAPVLFAATIYMLLGRIVRVTCAEHHAPIASKWLTRTFVIGDVSGMLIQGAGKIKTPTST